MRDWTSYISDEEDAQLGIVLDSLTEPQRRIYAEVREAGERTYNGRARRSVEALAAAGLVEYEYDVVLHASSAATERFVVRPT